MDLAKVKAQNGSPPCEAGTDASGPWNTVFAFSKYCGCCAENRRQGARVGVGKPAEKLLESQAA